MESRERVDMTDMKDKNNDPVKDNICTEAESAENNVSDTSPECGNAEEAKCGCSDKLDKDEEKDSSSGEDKQEADIKGGSRKLKAENKKLAEEKKELDEKYKRVLAEYDNFRKRAAKEKEGIYADAYADALKELLVVKDSLELALQYPDSGKVVEGVGMTLTKFKDTLTKLGVEEFGKAGETFDPNIHNAVMHVEDDSLGENEITDVLLKGYKKGDKIIRYAMVRVAN